MEIVGDDDIDPYTLAVPVFHPGEAAEMFAAGRSGVGADMRSQPSLGLVAPLLVEGNGDLCPLMAAAGRGSSDDQRQGWKA